ncbi:MAG TPA: cation:proton antiporter, partial [Terriglobia bacterium]|nr:cation:proton antiporter [Terriglobia bacterium]
SQGSMFKGLVGGFFFDIGVSLIFGVVAGVLWSRLMPLLSDQRFWQTLTFAAVLLLYAATSAVNASGLFAVLVFGLVLANLPKMKEHLRFDEMGIDLPDQGSHSQILSFHSELAFLIRTFFFVMIGAVVQFSGLGLYAIPILGFMGAILAARWLAVNLSSWTWKEISSQEKELMVLLLPRGLITAVLAIQVIEAQGTEFGFLRDVAFATILFTNLLVVLGSVRARRASPPPAAAGQISPQAAGD